AEGAPVLWRRCSGPWAGVLHHGSKRRPRRSRRDRAGQFLFGAGRMTLSGLFVQFINGLAEASSLFLVAAGLSLIFGVTRIVNFAHGSLYMLGLYVAYSLVERWGDSALGFWTALLCAALLIAML